MTKEERRGLRLARRSNRLACKYAKLAKEARILKAEIEEFMEEIGEPLTLEEESKDIDKDIVEIFEFEGGRK